MEEKTTKRRVTRKSPKASEGLTTNPKVAPEAVDKKPLVGLGACMADILTKGTKKVTKADAENLMAHLESEVNKANQEADSFEVLGMTWKPKKGTAIRTLFIGKQIFVEFPIDGEGKVTAFFPYTPYSEQHGSGAVTFPADWMVKDCSEQLVQMGAGATTMMPDWAKEAASDDDEEDGDDDDMISLDDIATEAIRRFGDKLNALFN